MEYIDANIVLRYILWDNEELSPMAEIIIENREIYIPFEVITEIVYVLEGVYNTERETIKENILGLIAYPNITTNDVDVLKYAFDIFTRKKFDLVDTLLIGFNKVNGIKIHTFDKAVNKYLNK